MQVEVEDLQEQVGGIEGEQEEDHQDLQGRVCDALPRRGSALWRRGHSRTFSCRPNPGLSVPHLLWKGKQSRTQGVQTYS